MTEIKQNQPKLTEIIQKWPKTTKIDQIDQNRSKSNEIKQYLPKMTESSVRQDGPKWSVRKKSVYYLLWKAKLKIQVLFLVLYCNLWCSFLYYLVGLQSFTSNAWTVKSYKSIGINWLKFLPDQAPKFWRFLFEINLELKLFAWRFKKWMQKCDLCNWNWYLSWPQKTLSNWSKFIDFTTFLTNNDNLSHQVCLATAITEIFYKLSK